MQMNQAMLGHQNARYKTKHNKPPKYGKVAQLIQTPQNKTKQKNTYTTRNTKQTQNLHI